MPSGPLAHVCMLVFDLDKAIADWTTLLEVLDPGQLEQRLVRYDDFEGGDDTMRWATFVNLGGSEIQLMEPSPTTPLGKRLAKHGEHVHHICFTVDDVAATSRRLAEAGVAISDEVFQDPTMPWQQWMWVMPKSATGALVEVARPYKAVDGTWVSGSPAEDAA